MRMFILSSFLFIATRIFAHPGHVHSGDLMSIISHNWIMLISLAILIIIAIVLKKVYKKSNQINDELD